MLFFGNLDGFGMFKIAPVTLEAPTTAYEKRVGSGGF